MFGGFFFLGGGFDDMQLWIFCLALYSSYGIAVLEQITYKIDLNTFFSFSV